MHTGTQLCAPEGFDVLRKGVVYHLLRSDAVRERVLLLEFRSKPIRRKAKTRVKDVGSSSGGAEASASMTSVETGSPDAFRPVLHYLSRHRFEQGLSDGLIGPCESQEELPPWFTGLSINELSHYAQPRPGRKKSHEERIDRILLHLWPLVQNLDQVLAAESPDAVINAHARACRPIQNETRLRTAFYAYICYGFSRWALHYAVHCIGRWDRMGRERKLGRPSRIYGAYHGYGTNDPEMIECILEGYRRFAGPGQHLSKIYRRTLTKVFGCVPQTDPTGRKTFVHPAGRPFPSLGQFAYRVAQAFPLDARQTHKYGHARVRNRMTHSQGRFAESVGNLMERTEQDAYCCDQVAIGYLPGSHLPALWVVRIRCIASGMIVGIGFSIGEELAAAYRMALFCAAIDKVQFANLFGLELQPEDWPSIGISPYPINDRGPGSTAKADPVIATYMPLIKEGTPSQAGQSKASVETMHPKPVKQEGQPQYKETRLTIPQLAVQEIQRAVEDNDCTDVVDRLNNEALNDRVFPTPAALWSYLDRRGRSHAITMRFEEAVRAYLDPIELTVRDDAVYFKDARFESDALKRSGALQKAHDLGRYTLQGYMLSVCVRHLWVEIGTELVRVDAMLGIRDGQEQLYISVLEIEQLQQIRRDAKLELKTHRMAARSGYEAVFEKHTGQVFDQATFKSGRSRRSKANSVKERQEIMDYLRAAGGRK
ncbi:hypothetical protein PQU96_09790 [Vogesella sp. LYT5W]|uniref:Transposase n=1 Tax=Vogesella margarita TaxID=2984199 RepID=A0ABT5IPH5_9NEIS|nr:hypothetical protein [Vogesella margarita]MDC7714418.1 hypothetical protein [Vogesella margarita]